jgi:CRP-like cAMP-binding protein
MPMRHGRTSSSGVQPIGSARHNNRLLAAVPDDEYERLAPHLTTVPLQLKRVLYRQGEPIHYVYFPHGGVCSVTAPLSNGAMIEVAAIGDEGMVGIEAFFTDAAVSTGEKMVQVTDHSADRLAIEPFRRELDRRGAFHDIIGRYAQAKIGVFVQTAACNALHTVQERCARWLLQMNDHLHRPDFDLSHELLATMLGANRSTVSVVAATFQRAGLIRYRRTHLELLDRDGLEAASCECYAHIQRLLANVDRS